MGTPIVARAEAEAARLHRAAKQNGVAEPFDRHLADAYESLLTGGGKGRATRPELVMLVSHEVDKRGWKDVRGRCVDCGNRFRTESDHVEPHAAMGPASAANLQWRCPPCHQIKTERDRRAGKLRSKPSRPERGPPGPHETGL